MNNTAILKNIQTQDLYRHLQGNIFKNLRTGIEGEIPEELSNKILKIDFKSTMLFNKYPLLEELVFKLKLKLDK